MGACCSADDKKLGELLAESTLSFLLTPEQLRYCAKFLVEKVCGPAESVVFAEGADDPCAYVVITGKVSFTHSNLDLGSKKAGEVFGGENVLADRPMPRPVTARITGNGHYLILQKHEYQNLLKQADQKLSEVLRAVLGAHVIPALRQVPYLSHIPEDKLHLLGYILKWHNLVKNEKVYNEGTDVSQSLHVVGYGCFHATTTRPMDPRVAVGQRYLRTGATFGQLDLLVELSRTETVIADENSILLSLNTNGIDKFGQLYPAFYDGSYRELQLTRTVERFKAFQVPKLKNFPDEAFQAVAAKCEHHTFETGVFVYHKGDRTSRLFLVAWGEFDELGEDNTVVRTVTAGGHFGGDRMFEEYIDEELSVRCRSAGVMIYIPKDCIPGLFKDEQDYHAEVIRSAGAKVPAKSVVHHPVAREAYKEHLEEEYSEAALNFYLEVLAFEKIPEENKEEIVRKCREIIATFLSPKAEDQINLQAEFRDPLLKIADQDITNRTLTRAKEEVLNNLESDSFRRFKETSRFSLLIERFSNEHHLQTKEVRSELEAGGKRS